jgi:hypothetical protein
MWITDLVIKLTGFTPFHFERADMWRNFFSQNLGLAFIRAQKLLVLALLQMLHERFDVEPWSFTPIIFALELHLHDEFFDIFIWRFEKWLFAAIWAKAEAIFLSQAF